MTAAENRNRVTNATFTTTAGPKTVEVLRNTANYYSLKSPKYPTVLRQNTMQIHEESKIRFPKPLYDRSGAVYDYFVPQYPPVFTYGQYSSRATFVLLNRINSRVHQGKAQLLTAFGERKKSIQMIQKRVGQAVPLIRDYKKESQRLERKIRKSALAPKKLKRLVKLLSDLRLEFSFGWAPIASDLYKLGNEIMPPIFFADVTASYVEEQSIQTVPPGYVGGYMGSIKLKAWCQISMSNPFSSSASQIGLTDPLETAWELVPWSFAVDWIWPLGDYLSQANMFAGLNVLSSSLTIRQTGDGDITFNSEHPAKGASSQLKLKHYRRTSFPNPSLPRFMDSPFGSLSRTLNQLALLGQMVGKTRPK